MHQFWLVGSIKLICVRGTARVIGIGWPIYVSSFESSLKLGWLVWLWLTDHRLTIDCLIRLYLVRWLLTPSWSIQHSAICIPYEPPFWNLFWTIDWPDSRFDLWPNVDDQVHMILDIVIRILGTTEDNRFVFLTADFRDKMYLTHCIVRFT